MIDVRPCSFTNAMQDPSFSVVLEQYAEESRNLGLPPPKPHAETYLKLEEAGMMHGFCAYADDKLIGFCNVLTAVIPHYSTVVATMESWFVLQEYRFTGAGVTLKHEAEKLAKQIGAAGLFISAPYGSDLADSMARHKPYREVNRVFFTRFLV